MARMLTVLTLPALGCGLLAACAPPSTAGLSQAQIARCTYEARRSTIYQGGILGAVQNVEMQQMCAQTAQLENRDAVLQRLQLTDGHSGTPVLRARLGGMAETCGMAQNFLITYRQKHGDLSQAEWATGARLAQGAPTQECATARMSVMQLAGV
jgi:hypothetical protein